MNLNLSNILKFLVIYLFFTNVLYAKSTLKWNKTYPGGSEFKINRVNFTLPSGGEWLLISIHEWNIKGISWRGATFVKEKNNTLVEVFGAGAVNSHGQFISAVDSWLYENVFGRSNYDGCLDKKEYFLVIKKRKSASFNCFIVRHDDVYKSIFYPDGKSGVQGIIKTFNDSWFRKWVGDKDIQLPKIMLTSDHYFYNKSSGYHAAIESHSINPEIDNGPETLFSDEETSEYHKFNIEKYPAAKKHMKSFIKKAAIKHKQFEYNVKAKENFKLDLSEFDNYKKAEIKEEPSKIINQLRDLKKLLDEGIITEDEFKKAKKKLLN